MGFWHTGYMEFHEATSDKQYEHHHVPLPPEYPCPKCASVFASSDDLAVHLFDAHIASRPVLMLQGRECGRSRLSVIVRTRPDDWTFHNATSIRVNDQECTSAQARELLAASANGVVTVSLEGSTADQDFEFDFSIADEHELNGVDEGLYALIVGQKLDIYTIEAFLQRTSSFASARRYRDSIANYLYGVLARDESPESGLVDIGSKAASYTDRFDDAVAELGRYERPPAEAISGLVALHYNHFDLALRKTRSPRVAASGARPDSAPRRQYSGVAIGPFLALVSSLSRI